MSRSDIGADRLVELLGALSETVILIGRDRTVQFMNRAAEGYDPDGVIGADALDFVDPEFRDAQAELYEQVLDTKEPARYEVPVTNAEGEG